MHRRENTPCNGKQTVNIPASRTGETGEERSPAWDQSQPNPNLHLSALLTPTGKSHRQTLSGFSPKAHRTSFSAKQTCHHPRCTPPEV